MATIIAQALKKQGDQTDSDRRQSSSASETGYQANHNNSDSADGVAYGQ